ncbi:DUF2274 domain-containing protein [Asticcacaulis sp. AND118]|uniref:DUF2274 domain-containing protein n=1 Tax=Asticcacaulis sp. AND118 TaxID=2840468 RepID=UPI001D0017DB|nr:DUF2274 domain-containing protein [Asticcacaulis sp. AND118]UDF04854.1 DUF2274 domain-containing protein [Asticcacaulis sp. AND118]
MGDLKLPKLPDRTPIKLTIVIGADLHEGLKAYADRYAEAYGSKEAITELVPYMLEAFLASDRGFSKGGRK